MEGNPLNSTNVEEVVGFVKDMHSKGWVHRDPNPSNFLRTTLGIATIDPIRAKKSTSMYALASDLLHMIRDMPSTYKIYGDDKLEIWLKIAQYFHHQLKLYRYLKHNIRIFSGYNPHKIKINNITKIRSVIAEDVSKND